MTDINIKTELDKLEKAIRLSNHNMNWIALEKSVPEITEEIESLFENDNLISRSNKKSIPTIKKEFPVIKKTVPKQQKIDPDITTTPTHPVTNPNTEIDKNPLTAKTLDSLRFRIKDCNQCDLSLTRKTIVFGLGNIEANLVFIGEGPGSDEDKTGLAFVGKAGKLLTQIIHSIGLNREDVYICNVVKCRPPGNRNPSAEEIKACSPILFKQLEILKPQLIVTLGNIATKTMLPNALGIMKMRGKLSHFNNTPLLPTFHPSYLLRNPSALNLVWNDMKQIRQFLFKKKNDN